MDNDHHAATAEPDTHTVGSILRRCREFGSISLEDAAEATKIGKNYLRALEADHPQELPSPAYLKGFLRTYATYLGLEPEELIQLATQQTGANPLGVLTAPQVSSQPRTFSWQRLVLPALLLTALIVSAYILSPSSPEHPRRPAQQRTQPVVPVAAVQAVRSSSNALPPPSTGQPVVGQETQAEAVSPKPQDGFMVRMKVNRNSSLSVVIDDAASQGYELTSGDLIEWKAAHTISLDLSDAASVEIELNGTPLKLQATPGKPAYIVLDANGIRR